MAHPLLADMPGRKELLLGNEAIVRGALEAGVDYVTCYPGTPSSEVPDTFFRLSRDVGKGETNWRPYVFEYSINEKVAMEAGGGASLAGALTMVTMKHVGVNVAADPLMTLAYIGTPGGLLLLSADDPGCHSSQNEQDNRYYARLASIACFEPSSAQEAKDMTAEALSLSRLWQRPIMLRTTTRVNHLRGAVEFGAGPRNFSTFGFAKDPGRFVPLPAITRVLRLKLLEHMKVLAEASEKSPWNKVWGKGRVGIVASGISRAYLHDALLANGWQDKVRVMELGMTYPLPERSLAAFLGEVDQVVVLEELEPILENDIRALAHRAGLTTPIVGKSEELPQFGEYSTRHVEKALCRVLHRPGICGVSPCKAEENLPQRPPNLCAGCSHRALFYSVREVFGDDAVYSSDIGCYTLGFLPPLRAADFLICMGSSISAGSGMARFAGKPVVSFIGDSTFFHSGITGIVNAVYNQHDVLVVVLDNRTTAMTGHQPNPGVDQTSLGPNPAKVSIEAVLKGCGVSDVRKVSPYHLKTTMQTLREMKEGKGVRALIAEEPCTLFARRTLGQKRSQVAYVAEQTPEGRAAMERFACPAFFLDNEGMGIDPTQCSGCMVCLQVSKQIKARKKGV